ncbi:hypothetical protein ACIP5Y_17585 [Nocardia sp. NPDC088792]|uniref:hypothetical protein n=1 Tax=Nocardia sp. NPDC088792 TaxID=3364332 RepID=UPI00380C0ACC
MFDLGPFVFVLPLRRIDAARCAILFGMVLALAVAVMLVVATSCGGDVSTDPAPGGVAPTSVGACAPFCSMATPGAPAQA